ncbi:hypothetical protein BJ741DRAFT_91819 [Chytriomyces cf. hyalinus JEL632]|nr:hypothetical protein BJ741DRAFT_91819 [Chytriomyces cf. hyalinus JEL632]
MSENKTVSVATNGTLSLLLDVNDHPVHIANLCIIVPALLLNLSLLICILRNSAVLLRGDIAGSKMETAVLNKTIFALLVSSLYNGLVILSSSALTLADKLTPLVGGPDGCNSSMELSAREINSRFALVVFGYLGIVVFFCTSVVLALERYWVIRFGKSVSSYVVWIVSFVGLAFYGVIMASFAVAVSKLSCHMPGDYLISRDFIYFYIYYLYLRSTSTRPTTAASSSSTRARSRCPARHRSLSSRCS